MMEDIELAEEIFGAIRENRLFLKCDPVCSVVNPSHVLYYTCRVKLIDSLGRETSRDSFTVPLEQLALIRNFDRYVVRRVIAVLQRNPQVRLGVRLSAESLTLDVVWEALLAGLSALPAVAKRLVVEITERSRLDPEKARRFCNRLRQIGCEVAIDDFGIRYGLETAVAIQAPDLIKIDASFMASIRRGESDVSKLTRMMYLASDLADQIIVDGIETTTDLSRAREAGAMWVQGALFTVDQVY
jgi:EAL domain-containing protein (putative c-di-GMP-specific phosphodiesterase class I)